MLLSYLRFGWPSDLLPSRFTAKVVVNVYLSSLPSRLNSNNTTVLDTLRNEAQKSTKI
jgi:hypothetical protein